MVFKIGLELNSLTRGQSEDNKMETTISSHSNATEFTSCHGVVVSQLS